MAVEFDLVVEISMAEFRSSIASLDLLRFASATARLLNVPESLGEMLIALL